MPYHVERFIHEVEEMPCVWDKSRDDYYDRDKRLSRWIRIAKNLHYWDWNDFSAEERDETVISVQRQWRELKHGYFKALAVQGTQEAPDEEQWNIYSQLSFLSKIRRGRKNGRQREKSREKSPAKKEPQKEEIQEQSDRERKSREQKKAIKKAQKYTLKKAEKKAIKKAVKKAMKKAQKSAIKKAIKKAQKKAIKMAEKEAVKMAQKETVKKAEGVQKNGTRVQRRKA